MKCIVFLSHIAVHVNHSFVVSSEHTVLTYLSRYFSALTMSIQADNDMIHLWFDDDCKYLRNDFLVALADYFLKLTDPVCCVRILFGPVWPQESRFKCCFSSSSGIFSPRWEQSLAKCWELSGPQLLLPLLKTPFAASSFVAVQTVSNHLQLKKVGR